MDKFLQDCDVSRLMQDLIGNYIMMEEYFMREMVLKVKNSLVLNFKKKKKRKTQFFFQNLFNLNSILKANQIKWYIQSYI